MEENQFSIARSYYKRCFEIDPKDEVTLIGLSKCFWKVDKDVAKAEQSLLSCMENFQNSERCFKEIIDFYVAIQKIPE